MPLSMQVTSMPSIIVDDVAGRQQRAAARARDVEELEHHRRGRAGHAVDARVALVFDRAARRQHARDGDAGGVDHVDAHVGRRRRAPATSPCSMAKGPMPARMLPQFWLSLTSASIDDDLQKQIIHVGVVARRRADDGDLAGQRMRRRPCRRSGARPASPWRRAARGRAPRARPGRSCARKYRPFDVPPRITVHGMPRCIG